MTALEIATLAEADINLTQGIALTISSIALGGTWSSWPANPVQLIWLDTGGNTNVMTFDLVQSGRGRRTRRSRRTPVEVGADVADHVRVELRKCELKVWATNEPIDANTFDQATLTKASIDVPGPGWAAGPGVIIVPNWTNPIELRAIAGSLVGLAGTVAGSAAGGANASRLVGDIAAVAGIEAADLLLPAFETDLPVQTDAGLQPTEGQTIQAMVQQWPGGATGTDYVTKTIAQLLALKTSAQLLEVLGTKEICFPMVISGMTTVRSAEQGTGAEITLQFTEVRIVSTQTVAAPIPHLPAGGGTPLPKTREAKTRWMPLCRRNQYLSRRSTLRWEDRSQTAILTIIMTTSSTMDDLLSKAERAEGMKLADLHSADDDAPGPEAQRDRAERSDLARRLHDHEERIARLERNMVRR